LRHTLAPVNHLAHAWLAGDDTDLVLGGLLADFWRGAPDPAWRPGLARGVRLHRRIDAWVDAHPLLLEARRWFDPPLRRYAGILLDVWFDHWLARDFERHAGVPLRHWCDALYPRLVDDPLLPAPFRIFLAGLGRHDALARYAEREHVEFVLGRIALRLTRANPVAGAGGALDALDRPLARQFEALLPALDAFARRERGA
jgi:acyl carrier protein phosphodiesterase